MDIKQLKYFLAIAEEGQITGAAKRLHVAQPALSQQLQLLENELNIQLAERGSRRLRLTEAGRMLRDRALQIVGLMDTTVRELQDLRNGAKGSIAIGTVPSAGTKWLPDRIHAFHRQYPDISFQIYEDDTMVLLDMLDNGTIDLGIVRPLFDLELYHSLELPPEPMIAAISNTWHSALPTNDIRMADLDGKPLLVHRGATRIIEHCRLNGFEPVILCRGDDVRSLLALAAAGTGIAIVPEASMSFVPSAQLQYRKLPEPALESRTVVIWHRSRSLSAAANNFLRTFTES
ncbi:MAG TPA: LysR family transcriptional regulator [Patescibacteria group bacterium]|nr:LysR family transcriptional regulator [Patescibacteria group bacterium]